MLICILVMLSQIHEIGGVLFQSDFSTQDEIDTPQTTGDLSIQ
jgi:hypothetical protein